MERNGQTHPGLHQPSISGYLIFNFVISLCLAIGGTFATFAKLFLIEGIDTAGHVAGLLFFVGFWSLCIYFAYGMLRMKIILQPTGIRFRNLRKWNFVKYEDVKDCYCSGGSPLFSYRGACIHVEDKAGNTFRIKAIPETFLHCTRDIDAWVDYINRRIAGEIESAETVDPVRKSIEAKQSRKFTFQKLGIFLVATLLLILVFFKFNNSMILVIPIILGARYLISRAGEKNGGDYS